MTHSRSFLVSAAWRWGLAVAVIISIGCAKTPIAQSPDPSVQTDPAAPPPAVPAPPTPKDATEIARSLIPTAVTASLEMERLLHHPLGKRLIRLPDVVSILESTDLDPQNDISSLFLASTGLSRQDEAILVIRHSMTPERLNEAIEKAIERSDPPGQWLNKSTVRVARIHIRSEPVGLVLADPDLLIVLQSERIATAKVFDGPLMYPPSDSQDDLVVSMQNPSTALRPYVRGIPATLSEAQVRVRLVDDGGAVLVANARSTTAEQAVTDAEELTRLVERLTTVKVSVVRIHLFRPVVFRAEQEMVEARVSLRPDEVRKLISMMDMLISKGNP
ncbi:MAG TPA: hypothetical protein PKL73_00840 [Polyangiaceae bacterium]|jgi:hypothetical protein|nr:MAG: hypothetical protein BWY17_00030 [Deltaproteobacteria bacterium ADurb.Bin207]HNS95463.1 hypothetical protein [Polyangiaceae bacterium]HNZ20597.1 hypothetical protein [Polyangiaceae bacterium]HOD20787.1 hypothetical protein [Polyangiaceae bacterium]HOE47207.1 hypothetical protein [Polyangiaceae bacterium]